MEFKLNKTQFGYYSVDPLPTTEELAAFYEKYYQNDHASYQKSYNEEEIKFFIHKAMIAEHLFHKINSKKVGTMFDVGAGEGFFALPFFENGWDVCTCDFSSHGMKVHNPSLLKTMILGDIFQTIASKMKTGETYDFISLKNVLEHVIAPVDLLKQLYSLLAENAVLRIEVPNDYSAFQNLLLQQNKTTNTWFCPPEHLNYFSFASLRAVLEHIGFSVRYLLTDFPIELFLLNEHSNYCKDRSRGKEAHFARTKADLFIYEQGMDAYIEFYSACAKANLGRNIIAYVSKSM